MVCIDQACQTEDFRYLEDLKAKIETLNKEIEALSKENEDLKKNSRETNSKPKFDIEDCKSSDEDISFYTGFQNYDTLILCFDLLKEKTKNLCYSDNGTTHFHKCSALVTRSLLSFFILSSTLLRAVEVWKSLTK